MKILLSFAVLALSGAAALYYLNFFQKGNEVNTVSGKSFYDLSITALDGKTKINFKDFKGKLEDALAKMVGDLKKFGLPNVKNLKIETLRPGYGEVVCQLVDELVNLELYRRDFEF